MRKPGGDGKPRWTLRWQRPVPALDGFSLASDGSVIAWTDTQGRVRRLDSQTGRQLWRTQPLPGRDGLLAAPGGQVLVWKRFAPQRPEVLILDALLGDAGARTQKAPGAIWSVAVSGDGQTLLVGAGDRTLTRYPLGASTAAPQTLRVEGYPESLAVGDSGEHFACGTWLPSGVSGPKDTWRHREPDPARWFDLQLSTDGSTLVALSRRGPRRRASATDARLLVWDAQTGLRLWEQEITGGAARVRVSEDGGVVALSFVAVSHYSTGDLSERRLSLFARDGKRLSPDRGGSYLAPELVALSASGNRITVLDMDRSLCTLDRAGRTVARLPLPLDPETRQPYSIRASQSSSDGQTLLMHRGDGTLALYQATAE